MYSEEPSYIEPDYSGDEIPFDSSDDDDDDDLDDIFPTDEDDDEAEIDKELGKEQNKLNEAQMSSSPFSTPSWQPTTGQQSTPFGGTPQPSYPWTQPQQQNSNPWGPRNTQPIAPQPQMLVPTSAIRIDRPKKHIIIDMFDGIIESWTSEGKPNIPPRAPYDIKLKFDVWNAIASFSPQFVYSIVPIMPAGDSEGWNITFQYLTTALSSYLRLPKRNCPIVTQGVSGRRKEDILKGILHLIPERERSSVVFVGIYSGYYNLGNEDLIAAKHCGIEYADLYQLLKGEI